MNVLKNPVKNWMNIGFFLLLCFILAICLWQYSQNKLVSLKYLNQEGAEQRLILSVKDRKSLDALMKKLFAEDSFAYTLIGSKPVSWASFRKPTLSLNWGDFRESHSKYHKTLRAGWKTWSKYSHLFPQNLVMTKSSKTHDEYYSIWIINEEQFDKVINQNKRDFQEVLGRKVINGYQLIQEAKGTDLMSEVLSGHQGLIGTVLGYGRENSWLFLEGYNKEDPLRWVWEEVESYLDHTLEPSMISQYSCPSFAGDPNSEESITLKSKYTETRKKIMDYYKEKDFLEATLSLLAGHRPSQKIINKD